jgi:acetoacetyl-CoA synthetase
MPGTDWFPQARVNYAHSLLEGRDDARVAIHHASELAPVASWTRGELSERVRQLRGGLEALGVSEGSVVAAYLPNVPDAVAAFLATAALGAVWTVAPPEFGPRAAIDRFAQLGPAVLLACDGYRYGGGDHPREAQAAEIAAQTGARLVRFGHLDGTGWAPEALRDLPMTYAEVAFDHPLWVLYTSGTTGPPKGLVHGHGGILLEQRKTVHLHLGAEADDRVLWFTTTGWMMWNYLVGVLQSDASIVLYDGSPAGDRLWDLCHDAGVTIFGTSAAFIAGQMKADARPAAGRNLRIRAVGSTGSPLAPEGFTWLQDQLGTDTWVFSMSGGTDVCTAFVGGVPTLPVRRGELQAPALGVRLEAFDPGGVPLPPGEVGELVVSQPLPSMPVAIWGDDGGHLMRESYFDMYPGAWRHGDWLELTPSGGAVIHGRSDATINRGGVRIGTSEIYRSVLADDDIVDALAIDVPSPEGATSALWLFVVLRDGTTLDERTRHGIAARLRGDCSPRHVPDRVVAIEDVPRTLTGKAIEVPVKRILSGADPATVVARASLRNPEALDRLIAAAHKAA